jgi:inner membrane protein
MDSLTQIVLGAAVGEAVLGKKVGNKAAFWGAVAGTIPDLDVLCTLFLDAVTSNELHRGFSHSIVFSLLFAPIFGWLVYRLYGKKESSWKEWTKLMFWSLFTHPLLDLHTTWGTQLLWPLETKISFKNIFVVDPFYTLPFLLFLLLALAQRRGTVKRMKLNQIGLFLSSAYMILTLIFKWFTYRVFEENLRAQQIEFSEIETKPTPLNSILWSANVATEDAYLIGYYSLLDASKDVSFLSVPKNHHLLGDLKDDPLIHRLIKLSKGWYTIEKKDEKLYFNDLRFGLMGVSPQEKRFVFSYELCYDDELIAIETPKNTSEIGPLLKALFQRVKGI